MTFLGNSNIHCPYSADAEPEEAIRRSRLSCRVPRGALSSPDAPLPLPWFVITGRAAASEIITGGGLGLLKMQLRSR